MKISKIKWRELQKTLRDESWPEGLNPFALGERTYKSNGAVDRAFILCKQWIMYHRLAVFGHTHCIPLLLLPPCSLLFGYFGLNPGF